jgi:hypothetical protein
MSSILCQKPGGQTIPEDERVQRAGILYGVGVTSIPCRVPGVACHYASRELQADQRIVWWFVRKKMIAMALVSLTRRHSAFLSNCLLGERVRGATAKVKEKTVLRVSQISLHATEVDAAAFTEKSYANQ